MDTDIRTLTIKTRTAERMREAAEERLAQEARTCSSSSHGATQARHRHGLLRLAVAAGVLGLAAASARPAAAGVGHPGGSVLFDPWEPLAAPVEQGTTIRWDCVGLPRPSAPVPSPATGTPDGGVDALARRHRVLDGQEERRFRPSATHAECREAAPDRAVTHPVEVIPWTSWACCPSLRRSC